MQTDIDQIRIAPEVPQSREAEEAVLGSIQINPDCLPEARGIINYDDDFYSYRNRWIWQVMCYLDEKKIPIDVLTLSNELQNRNQLQNTGGVAYLTMLLNQSPSSLNVNSYAKIVHAHGVRRRMIEAANNVARLAYDTSLEVEDVVAKSIEGVQQAANGLLGGRAQSAHDLAGEYYDNIDKQAQRKELPGIPSGFVDLDILFGGGFQAGEFSLVAGFPGIGKTSFLDTVALHVAKTYQVALFTLEMSNKEQMNRFIAQETGINSQRLRSGKLQENEWAVFTYAIEQYADLKIKVDDTTPLSMMTMRAKCVQWKSQKKCDLIIIDYAGLLEGIGKDEYQVFSYLSKNLKLLARETNCHVLAAHQLNRKGREFEKPSIQHLRGSGTWEQDADNVLLLWEPKNAVTASEYLPRTLEIAKQRNGPTENIYLQMKKSTTKYQSASSCTVYTGDEHE